MTAELRDSLAQVQELKPCPFCGGEPKFTEVGSDLSKSRKLTIQCKGCRFKLTNAAIRHGFDWLYEITITAWNNRHGAGDAEDAARYRWLRENPSGTRFRVPCPDAIPNCKVGHRGPNLMGEELDAAIDAARAGERGVLGG